MGAVGAVVSGHADVGAASVLRVERFPAASYASTPRVYVVPQASPVNVEEVLVTVPAAELSRNVE